MAEFDLFELTGLPFDEPESNAKKVNAALESKIAELGNVQGRKTQEIEKKTISSQKAFLEKVKQRILSEDGKKIIDAAYYKELADEKVEVAKKALMSTLTVLAISGNSTATTSRIKYYRKSTGLSEDHVKEVFVRAGYQIVDIDPLSGYPKFPVQADRVRAELNALRNAKNLNPDATDNSIITDLYSFVSYLKNDTGKIDYYRSSAPRSELLAACSEASIKYATAITTDTIGSLCKTISTNAKTYVFDTDEHKDAYDQYLLYHCEELTRLFSAIKNIPPSDREDPKIADKCIEIISTYFPAPSVALAIYNKEAGTGYIPSTVRWQIKCGYCGTVNRYNSEEEAKKQNTCQNCKRPLFKKCDKCGRLVPADKGKCPNLDCQYIFANEALFPQYYQSASMSLRKGNFDEARHFLLQAASAAPKEKDKIDRLAQEIDAAEKEAKKPIDLLRSLKSERKYQRAQSELATIIRQFPRLDLSEFERDIQGEIHKADVLFEKAAGLSKSKRADACVEVLSHCVDYTPALDYLRATAPLSCASITASADTQAGTITLGWTRSNELGTSYRLLRKKGTEPAASEHDGTILLDNSSATSFVDNSISPCTVYTYSVFVCRKGAYSAPVFTASSVISDVQNCRVIQRNNCIRITWDAPAGSFGATVIRSCNGQSKLLSRDAQLSYEDSAIDFGKTYSYRVCANYAGNITSQGITSVITPLIIIDTFSIRIMGNSGSQCRIAWSIPQPGVNLRIVVNGVVIAEAKSEDPYAQVSLPLNTYCEIVVRAYSGGEWIESNNTLHVSTFEACEINKNATGMEEVYVSGSSGDYYRITLKIKMTDSIPSNVTGFYYSVRSSSAPQHWTSVVDLGEGTDIQRISISQYEKQGALVFQDTIRNETSFFVSVFTVYRIDGKEIISEPKRMKIDRPFSGNLFWSIHYSRFEGLKLEIEMKGNRPIDYIPELILCACDSDKFLAAYDSKNSQIITKIQAVDLDSPQDTVKKSISVPTQLASKYLKKCKYFLFSNDADSKNQLTLRWMQGFSGKV